MNGKRLIFTSLLSIILVCMLLIGTTYSIFTTGGIEENTNVYKTANLDITYTLSADNIKLESNIPTKSEDSIYIKPYRINVSNKGNTPYKFNIILNNTTATSPINSDYIMTQIGKEEPKNLSSYQNNIIKSDVTILAGTSINIDIRVFLTEKIPNTEVGKNFTASISIEGIATSDIEPTAIDNSNLEATYLEKHSIIDIKNAISDKDRNYKDPINTTNTGLYYTSDNTTYGENKQKIYYYAGDYDQINNWVIFGKNSDNIPMCFRIIRTTKTGGTKLIYSGLANNNNCTSNTKNSNNLFINNTSYSSTNNNPTFVLWKGQYPNQETESPITIENPTNMLHYLQNNLQNYAKDKKYNSNAQNKVEEWYYKNIVNTGYKNYLEKMNLCIELGNSNNSQSSNSTNETNDYYFNNEIDTNYHPSYNCSQTNQIESPYGLLTLSEAVYAGLAISNPTSPNNWLLANNNYWTLSPSHITSNNLANMKYIDKSGIISSITPDKELYLRPVISLKPKITSQKGDGSINNPYIIK